MADVGDPDFSHRLTEIADRITVALDQLIPPAQGPEADLMRAMRHSALANGKRMRPFYVIETGAMFDAPEKSLCGPRRRWNACIAIRWCMMICLVWTMMIFAADSQPCIKPLMKRRRFLRGRFANARV